LLQHCPPPIGSLPGQLSALTQALLPQALSAPLPNSNIITHTKQLYPHTFKKEIKNNNNLKKKSATIAKQLQKK